MSATDLGTAIDWTRIGSAVDLTLLLYIALLLVLKAILIRRRTRFGWAMALNNAALAGAFLWALFARVWDGGRAELDIAIAIRALIAITVTFAIVELLSPAFRRD